MTELLPSPALLSREHDAMKGLDFWARREPRRSHTVYNYEPGESSVSAARDPRRHVHHVVPERRPERSMPPAEKGAGNDDEPPRTGRPVQPAAKDTSLIRRPLLPPPRRSYSVMDYEPIPHYHRSSARMTLMDLPGEIHYSIFDFLDAIDSTCLGLTNRHFYAIHRRMRGVVPLSARRDGPNELEWAWHLATHCIPPRILPAAAPPNSSACKPAVDGAGCESPPPSAEASPIPVPATPVTVPASPETPSSSSSGTSPTTLARLRVRGQAYCRKCGITRCELHKHIQDWMGADAEYCSVKQKFGTAAPDGAKPYCYMSRPGDPTRCGRHKVWRHKVVLQ